MGVVEDVSIYLDIVTLEFWAIWERPPFLLDCRLILRQLLVNSPSGSLAVTSITFCSGHLGRRRALFSQKKAQAPESSFTMSPRSTTLPFLYFCNLGSNSAFFEVTYVHQCSKVDILFASLCFQNNLLFALYFVQISRWNCRELLPFLVHCCLCIHNFHRLVHRNKLVHQIDVNYRIVSFACNVIFVIFRQRWFQTLSRWFMSFHNARMLCFWNHVGFITPRFSFLQPQMFLLFFFCNWNFKLSPRIFDGSFIFSIFQINKKYLSIVERYRVLASRLPILASLSFERLFQFWSILQATLYQVW